MFALGAFFGGGFADDEDKTNVEEDLFWISRSTEIQTINMGLPLDKSYLPRISQANVEP